MKARTITACVLLVAALGSPAYAGKARTIRRVAPTFSGLRMALIEQVFSIEVLQGCITDVNKEMEIQFPSGIFHTFTVPDQDEVMHTITRARYIQLAEDRCYLTRLGFWPQQTMVPIE